MIDQWEVTTDIGPRFRMAFSPDAVFVGPMLGDAVPGSEGRHVFRNTTGPSFYLISRVRKLMRKTFPNAITWRDCVFLDDHDLVLVKLACND